MQTADLMMEQSSQLAAQRAASPPGIKTILFHVHKDDGLEERLQVALSLARSFGAHLHLLHVTPIQAYMVTDAFAVFVSPQIMEVLEDESAKLRAKLEQELSTEDVSWDYEDVTGELIPRLIQRAALADLVLIGRQPQDRDLGGPAIALLGDLLQSIKTPLLIIGDEIRSIDLFGPAVVAWNGSQEAANALRGALPLLKLASRVRLIEVEEPSEAEQFPSTRPLEYLSRHGVHAELAVRSAKFGAVEEQLVDEAIVDGASYIVMGGYSHSRAGEFMFGGVTRSLLRNCPIAVVTTR